MPQSLADIRAHLFASVLSDCLDAAGVMDQALPSRIRPLDEASVMVGRARTAQFMEVDHQEAGTNPYELEIALIDSLVTDEIPVFACSNPARVAPVVAYEQLCTFEFGIAAEMFGLSRPEFEPWYSFSVCGLGRRAVRATGGVTVLPQRDLRELQRADTIIIPGWPKPIAAPPASVA